MYVTKLENKPRISNLLGNKYKQLQKWNYKEQSLLQHCGGRDDSEV